MAQEPTITTVSTYHGPEKHATWVAGRHPEDTVTVVSHPEGGWWVELPHSCDELVLGSGKDPATVAREVQGYVDALQAAIDYLKAQA